ncbi:hypothetical protein PPL_08543 [Heterostelium album PN500]|uniref:Ankyrin repeat protein n=1 Tax=Heterostelium pallidum (strain ATCC 26659 / Pp 5 / PN500) TaxID=670386 RepID=D3BJ24_HETP5|nr:hypothetical protein PPL_08543 [Heterostelium album PN500]EFA77904.1 hypothetical protein PPL_08543 [Heterostelium album PN500]|eukprot:XP_020430032.1 hypothetical protein PPL_08543 [Heterostelium album PN500]
MNKDIFIKLFNNYVVNQIVFRYVRIINLRGSSDNRHKSYRWSDVLKLPHMMASHGYLTQLESYFNENAVSNNCEYKSFKNAIISSHIDIVRYMLDQLHIDIRKTKDRISTYHVTKLLNCASKYGRLKIIRYLCDHSQQFKWDYYEAMTRAPLSGDFEVLKYMVEKVNQLQSKLIDYSRYKKTVFDNAAFVGRINMIEWLEVNRAQDKPVSKILFSAIKGNQVETVQYLLKDNNIELTIPREITEDAIKRNHLEVLRVLPSSFVSYGESACQLAIDTGNLELVKLIHNNNTTATRSFETASLKGSIDIVKWLFESQVGECTPSAFECACSSGNMELVNYLIDKVQIRNAHLAVQNAIVNGNLELVKLLNVLLHDNFKDSMDLAAENGQLEILSWLNENRKDLNCTTLAMDRAVINNHFNVVRWLYLNRTEGCTRRAIDYAAENGCLDIIQLLNENYSMGFSDYAVEKAAENGHLDVVQWLSDNSTNEIPTRALINSVRNGHTEVVKYLYPITGQTFIHLIDIAASRNFLEIVQYLDENNETCSTDAMDNAAGNGHLDVLQWFHENRSEGCTGYALYKAFINQDNLTVVEWLYKNRSECKNLLGHHHTLITPIISNNQFDKLQWILDRVNIPLNSLQLYRKMSKYPETTEIIDHHLLKQKQTKNP